MTTITTRNTSPVKRRRTPLRVLLDIFSSVWTGVTLLVTLFVYSSLGSAVPALRQLPAFEMTEFEWFNWWPFVVLVGLICLTLTVTTLRRIPLRPVNYGVWMIHSGIIVLSVGSVVYFGTKLEGDTPVARRQVTVRLPGHEPVSFVAMPGNSIEIGSPDRPYRLQVASIDPQWEILSGLDAGRRAYSVNVLVQAPDQTFMRQLLAGYPQYTEDLVRSTEPGPPWARAKKLTGEPLVDDQLDLALEYATEQWFYLSNDIAKSWALYLREVPGHVDPGKPGPWIERPIDGLPLYNDYVADLDDVWLSGDPSVSARPLHVAVEPVDPADPLPEVTFEVNSYLRYAVMETRRLAGGDVFDPVVRVRVDSADGRSREYELIGLDPAERMEPGGRLVFEWVDSETDFDAMLEVRDATLSIRVDAASVELEFPIRSSTHLDPDLPYTAIEGTDYQWRVRNLHDGLRLPTGEVISVAAVEIKSSQRTWVRWVSDDPTKTRDLPGETDMTAAHGQSLPLEQGIVMEYSPGSGPAPITIAAGPAEDELRLVVSLGGAVPRVQRIAIGQPMSLSDTLQLTVLDYATYTTLQSRPAIVPPSRRNKDMQARLSMIEVEAVGLGGTGPVWLPFHHWPFDDAQHAFGRAMFRPTEVALPDGRLVELMFSRQRRRLPARIALDDFVMDTHAGGFSGQNISVVNWTSEIRFRNDDGWSEPLAVSVNDPQEYGGLWYFQAQWDPPDPAEGYAGLNYTVLGVGNRHGVNVMLVGCCVTVLGMIFAFYVKPFIKRRQRQAVYAQLAAQRHDQGREAGADVPGTLPEPVGVVREQS